MTDQELKQYCGAVTVPDREIMDAARRRQAELAKPPGSLGKLEDYSIRLAGITGQVRPHIEKCRVLVLAADNGVTAEGISSAPTSVTLSQVINMTRHKTGMSALAHYFGNEVVVADMGIDTDRPIPGVLDRKVRRSTGNIAREPAMTRQQALQALETGMELAAQAAADGVQALGIGEMGIGNTTTSSAVAAVLLGQEPVVMTGRGAGLSDAGLQKKIHAIETAVAVNRPDPADVLDVLHKVGGLDIAGLAGVFLGGALCHTPVLVDGFISSVAALVAARLCPACKDYMLGSHASEEPASRLVLSELGLRPFLYAGMRLGEGTGAVAVMPLLDMGLAVYREMATFEDTNIEAYQPLG